MFYLTFSLLEESTIRLVTPATTISTSTRTNSTPMAVIPPPATSTRRATISMVPSSAAEVINVSSIDTRTTWCTLLLANTASKNLIYRDGQMHLSTGKYLKFKQKLNSLNDLNRQRINKFQSA